MSNAATTFTVFYTHILGREYEYSKATEQSNQINMYQNDMSFDEFIKTVAKTTYYNLKKSEKNIDSIIVAQYKVNSLIDQYWVDVNEEFHISELED